MREGYARDRSLGEIVEAHVARAPHATAVIFGDERLSYDCLNRRANRLARHLRAHGAGAGALVATFLDRSADMVVAWLAIAKTGGAYVPLDPESPRERLRFMLDDCAARAVVATSRLRPLLPPGFTVVSLDDDRDAIAAHSGDNLSCGVTGGWLAHVIYTSGSTGQPKGVSIPHRGVSRLVLDTTSFAIGTSDRVSQTANAAFDAATFEVWGALLNGACLVGIPREVVLSPHDLMRRVREQQISVLFLTTALFNVVAGADPRAFAGVRAVFTGGEAMSPRSAREVLAAGAPGQLVNAYGPTENSVFTTCSVVRHVPPEAATVPIGTAVDHTDVRLLDEGFEPVAAGAPGELCTGGDGLADGYWRRPDITAASFVPHPFSATPGARLYRTGDRARRLAGGAFEFLGRLDAQVKVRGHRIEPGEIEAALLRHPAVAEALVMVREDRPGEKRLTAYVRQTGGARPSATELRAFVADRLPACMIPSAFIVLEALPLTPGGKVDRRALPAPAASRPALGHARVAPRNPVEETLAGLWASLLGVPEIGVHDDFMELGGHSLLAGQLMARVNDAFAASLPLATIFERPTVALMAGRLVEVDRREMPVVAPLARAPRGGPLPLSFSQEQVWFLNELEPGNLAYNFQALIRFSGALDVAALERTLEEIVRRHEILRTAFVTVGDRPAQVIVAPMRVALPVVDLRLRPEDDRRREADRWFDEQCRTPFDLGRPPLARWTLLRTGDEEHVLVHVEHHLVHDGWSFSLLLREMKTLYQAFSKGEPSPLPDPAWQFADYAVWQRETLQGAALDAHVAFWRQRLAGAPPALDLPTDRPRPDTLTFRGGCERFDLPADLYASLRAFSRREKVTLFMTMAAAFKTLLSRYTGQEDIVIGSGMANRTRRELESVIGMFVNPVVMRTDLSGSPTFRELVHRVRAVAIDAYAHQDTPFGKLVEALQPARDAGRNPIFQVLFSFHDAAVPDLTFDGLTGTIVERPNGSAKFDLNVICIPRVEQRVGDGPVSEALGLTVLWEFNADLFERATTVRLFGEYQNLLRAAMADPDRRLSELPILAPADRHRLLVEWNAPPAAGPEPQPIHSLFEAQVRRTPGAVAIELEGERLTYWELNRRANQLAHHLRRAGARPETLVGLVVERSLEIIVALLAVLKAGAAYVPIDPEYPADRIAFMLADAAISLLVTEEHFVADLPPHGARVITLDAGRERIAAEPEHDPAAGASAGNLAYVIYTSGSTGTPKGAMVTHANIARLFTATGEWFHFGESDVWTLFHSYAFDFSVWEMWGALLHGGRLIVIPRLTSRSPDDVYALVCREGVTILNQTPTAFRQLIAAQARSDGTHRLRHVIFGGEALEVATLEPWHAEARNRHTRLVNMYGITETTVHVTCHPLAEADAGTFGGSPIGRRIPDLRVYILDAHGEPVPVGVAGELFVAGAGVARGYLNRPALTAERFSPDAFGHEPGARMYRTGDLARWAADGRMAFLGRNDFQVKIRGFRIELGEIEACLAAQPGVRDAVVVARDDTPGDRQLVAYYTCDPESEPGGDLLRTALARSLPAYMVPAACLRLDSLPLTAHGKLDRQALPAPDFSEGLAPYVAPRTELETQIADIWKKVLGVERVGARDYFFDLGGHSLKTVQIRSRLSEELGIDIPLRAVFEHPTVERQAQWLSSPGAGTRPGAPRQTIPRVRDAAHYPLSRAQRRLWFLHRLDPGDAFYNRPTRVALRGRLDRAAFGRAFDRLVQRHDALRTRFSVVDDEPVQSIAGGFRAPIECHDLCTHDDRRREAELRSLLIGIESKPFTLEAPPVRAVLCRLSDRHHVFVLVLHHIATDGWSGQVLLEDLASLYAAEQGGGEPSLSPLPIRYVDYAAWQDTQAREGALEDDGTYWIHQLAGEPPRLELPVDGTSGDGGPHVEVVECEAADAVRLADLAQRHGATTFMLRTAILQAFLARFTGRTDVLIGVPAAGRPHPELERLVGFFANTLALRTDFSEDPSFAGALARVRRTALDAYVHEAYPFDLLIERLKPPRDADRLPLLQVLFTIEPALDTRTAGGVTFEGLPDLALELAVAGGAAARAGRLELTVSCIEQAGGRLAWVFLLDGRRISKIAARRLAFAFQTFLGALVEHPDRRLSELPVLPPSERQRVLADWNATGSPYQVACLHELIEAQVRRTPDAIAVWCGSDCLRFGELDRRANWVAHRLRELGVGPDVLVGLYLERTLDLVIAVLATFKAGGAYLPLDPKYPRARVEWTLADAGATVVLTDRAGRDGLPAVPGIQVWTLDQVWRDPAAEAEHPPESGVTPRHLAYVIYTSGSTGTAKGVAIEHASVSALLHASRDIFTSGELMGVVASASICFDLSVFEILTPLAWGGTVILVENALHVGSIPPCSPVTMVSAVPSAMAELLRGRALPESTRAVNLGGELLQNRLAQQVYETSRAERVFNLYGPTEATTYSASWLVPRGATGNPPIGRPISNTRLYVLDRHFEPVPVGAVGELYIGGAGVARGYHRRPDLTAERFVPDPFASIGARLYYTGDRVRYRADGALAFLGRSDDQVKLRGYRIELGEVERAFSQHELVGEAVVVVREDTPGERGLVAYVVPSQERSASGSVESEDEAALAGTLRRSVAATLPAYMVPRAIVILRGMPRQPNGKVNRAALPAPAVAVHHENVAPRTGLEREIAAIWADLLGCGTVGIDDNVFELGAHSLMATKVHRRVQDLLVARWAGGGAGAPSWLAARIQRQVRELVAEELPLRRVFDHPTVRLLAASVSGGPEAVTVHDPFERDPRPQQESLLDRA